MIYTKIRNHKIIADSLIGLIWLGSFLVIALTQASMLETVGSLLGLILAIAVSTIDVVPKLSKKFTNGRMTLVCKSMAIGAVALYFLTAFYYLIEILSSAVYNL